MGAIDSKIRLYQSDGAVRIEGDTDFNSYNVRARVDGATIGIKVVDTDDIFASKAYVRIAGATKALKLRGIPMSSSIRYRKAGSAHNVDSNVAWSNTYADFLSASWVGPEGPYTPSQSYLVCEGARFTAYGEWAASIRVWKTDITFQPVNYITEAEWNSKSSPLTLIIPRAYDPFYVDQETGGAIKCVQTSETIEQLVGNLVFSIPKAITDYNEFSLTMEGLCRNIGDLKHSTPVWNKWRYKGFSDPSLETTQIL